MLLDYSILGTIRSNTEIIKYIRCNHEIWMAILMALDDMFIIKFRFFFLLFSIIIILAGFVIHLIYISNLDSIIQKLATSNFSRSQLIEACKHNQGSNFNTILFFSWSLLFVCIVTQFLQTSEILKLSIPYEKFIGYGIQNFWILLPIIIIITPICVKILNIYSIHRIDKLYKVRIYHYVPILLIISLCLLYCSPAFISFGYFYYFFWGLSYATILTGELILLQPIYLSAGGMLRRDL